jgi:hypothetical protein
MLIIRTTFVSAVFATLNSLALQEYVARWISDYLTSETGVTVMYVTDQHFLDYMLIDQIRVGHRTQMESLDDHFPERIRLAPSYRYCSWQGDSTQDCQRDST